MTNVTSYKEMLAKPWGKIQYEIIFAQLSHIKNQNVLDFGAGFCLTAQHLAKENNVTAIEPNPKLLYDNQSDNIYKILGSYEALRDLPNQSFDTIICHNVLEYIDKHNHPAYFDEFSRLLKPNGELSLIKHNITGKILQSVIFSNDTSTAMELLTGEANFKSASFDQGNIYTLEELKQNTNLLVERYQGIRTFYSLQPNHFKTETGWLNKMLAIELSVADKAPYKDIAFLQHITLKKSL